MSWKDPEFIALAIGGWGAVLSTLLAAREFLKERVRLSVSHRFTGDPDGDDEITIVNLSSAKIFVSNWELSWTPRWGSTASRIEASFEEIKPFEIAPQSKKSIHFAGPTKLSSGLKFQSGRKLVLSLWIHGRSHPKKLVLIRGPWSRN
ncbi:hypothetical protein L1787_06010 [Acuticoccus sp. M5D2P5]|uniref:hypothetical protein n=1 Tax=Acuticoccus kalidii TaxID=2910977 RepID=UPI001F2DFD11|nr:hypothetical protein [Acuticoccus kalidii]MCF3932968.1 hypothetical protein [Acuticoccus kalidii]